jgi:hypothetical protein
VLPVAVAPVSWYAPPPPVYPVLLAELSALRLFAPLRPIAPLPPLALAVKVPSETDDVMPVRPPPVELPTRL